MQYLEENSVNFFQPEHKILFAYKSGPVDKGGEYVRSMVE